MAVVARALGSGIDGTHRPFQRGTIPPLQDRLVRAYTHPNHAGFDRRGPVFIAGRLGVHSSAVGPVLTYADTPDDERVVVRSGLLVRPVAFCTRPGVTVEYVITDNAFTYRRSDAIRDALAAHGIMQKSGRSNYPCVTGEIERLNRVLAIEWVYVRLASSEDRAAALSDWLNHRNPDRHHLGIGHIDAGNQREPVWL